MFSNSLVYNNENPYHLGLMDEVTFKLNQFEAEHSAIASRSLVMEMLINVFGPRGIQNFVFLGLLKQIEFIANSYLNVLADGGIQLSLVQQQVEVEDEEVQEGEAKKKKKPSKKSSKNPSKVTF